MTAHAAPTTYQNLYSWGRESTCERRALRPKPIMHATLWKMKYSSCHMPEKIISPRRMTSQTLGGVERQPIFSGCHGFDSRRGFRFFLCPTLVKWSLFHLSYFTTKLKHSGKLTTRDCIFSDKSCNKFLTCWECPSRLVHHHLHSYQHLKIKSSLIKYNSLCGTSSWHFGLLFPRNTWCDSAWFGGQVSSKYGTWYSVRVIGQSICVGSLAGFISICYTVLMSSNKNETAVHDCNPAISVLVVLVSHKVYFLCSTISLAVLFVTWSSDLPSVITGLSVHDYDMNYATCFVRLWHKLNDLVSMTMAWIM